MPGESIKLDERFRRAASWISCALGSAWAFVAAVSLVLLWAAAGPFLGYSNNWQLVINTGTTIATFLMLFVLQNSQNRDTKALNLKLDELLRAIEGARTRLVNVNELSDAELSRLEEEFRKLASQEGRTVATDDTAGRHPSRVRFSPGDFAPKTATSSPRLGWVTRADAGS